MRTARLFLFIIFGGLLFAFPARAQWNNTEFRDALPTDSTKEKKLYFNLHTLSFLKDNEYSSFIADGYTLFGYQFQPFFSYFPFKNVRINAGMYLQKDFGDENFSSIEPFFSIKLSHRDLSIIFGNLEGSLNHGLIEPLYDFESVLKNRQEQGLQFLLDKRKFSADLWVNWETMISKGDPFQEEISGGLSVREKINLGQNSRLEIPAQMIIYHRGGQIDSSPGLLLTRYNIAAGLTFVSNPAGFINELSISPYYVYSNGDDPPNGIKSDSVIYGNGNAAYLNIGVKTRYNFQIIASFWASDNFSSEKGGQLYSSESSSFKKAGLVEEKRTLLILRVFHKWQPYHNLSFSSRFEPYYDFGVNEFEFSFGFYLNYRPEFFLWRNK